MSPGFKQATQSLVRTVMLSTSRQLQGPRRRRWELCRPSPWSQQGCRWPCRHCILHEQVTFRTITHISGAIYRITHVSWAFTAWLCMIHFKRLPTNTMFFSRKSGVVIIKDTNLVPTKGALFCCLPEPCLLPGTIRHTDSRCRVSFGGVHLRCTAVSCSANRSRRSRLRWDAFPVHARGERRGWTQCPRTGTYQGLVQAEEHGGLGTEHCSGRCHLHNKGTGWLTDALCIFSLMLWKLCKSWYSPLSMSCEVHRTRKSIGPGANSRKTRAVRR